MVEPLQNTRRWLRVAHGHGTVYVTRRGRIHQFYTVSPQGLLRLVPDWPKKANQRGLLLALGWRKRTGCWASEKSSGILLTELAASLGWPSFSVRLEVLR